MNADMRAAVEFLYNLPKFTSKNSPEHTGRLLELLGSPCADRKVIHVAGSNGKGSVCLFLYHMLLACGKSAAVFLSPHLVDIRERFQINANLVSEGQFLDAYARVRCASLELIQNNLNHPTFFEFLFAMGMVIFGEADAEYIILETGLGGRLDATNTISRPVLSVITSIALEHTEVLGSSLAEIAAEKAGIIKPGVPVVFASQNRDVARVFSRRAEQLGCPAYPLASRGYRIRGITKDGVDFSLLSDYDKETEWFLSGQAVYQAENAALAVTAARFLGLRDDIALQRGMLASDLPGRMQQALPEVYFDGAHNPAGVSVFAETVGALTEDDPYPPLLLFSMMRKKDVESSVALLAEAVPWDGVAVTAFPDDGCVSPDRLKKLFEERSGRPADAFPDCGKAFFAARAKKQRGQRLFCAGSLYLIGALMKELQREKEEGDDRF